MHLIHNSWQWVAESSVKIDKDGNCNGGAFILRRATPEEEAKQYEEWKEKRSEYLRKELSKIGVLP